MKLGPYELGPNDTPENGIYTGDARELAKAIPDESVDLIFTDPVYQNIEDYRWLAGMASRALKDGASCLAYCAHVNMDAVIVAMNKSLQYRWLMIHRKYGINSRMWDYHLFGWYLPVLWFSKGKGRPRSWVRDLIGGAPNGGAVNYTWSKNADVPMHWMASFISDGQIVFDPFCGGGALLESAIGIGRHYLAFEIDPDTAELARERVRNTQPPLPLPEPEQEEMFGDNA
jgi:DNA modification methylase